MKFLTISEFLLVLILPFLLFLIVFNFYAFNNSFYQQKFLEYKIEKNVPNAASIHENIINFVEGKSNELPKDLNEREKQHLWDVRRAVRTLTITLYFLIILFILLTSVLILKENKNIINFIGKILVFGGALTIIIASALFFFISLNFSTAFESFHMVFFQKGTYVFDPAKEIIVNLYPEQLFMDIGLRISKGVVLISAIIILVGAILMLKSKNKKNKKG